MLYEVKLMYMRRQAGTRISHNQNPLILPSDLWHFCQKIYLATAKYRV